MHIVPLHVALTAWTRLVIVMLLLPAGVTIIDVVATAGASEETMQIGALAATYLVWCADLFPLVSALVVVDTVAQLDGEGAVTGAASLGLRREILVVAALVGPALGAGAVGLCGMDLVPGMRVVAAPGEGLVERLVLERTRESLTRCGAAVSDVDWSLAPTLRERRRASWSALGDDRRGSAERVRRWAEPWLGLLLALTVLGWLGRRHGSGGDDGRATALVITLVASAPLYALWSVGHHALV